MVGLASNFFSPITYFLMFSRYLAPLIYPAIDAGYIYAFSTAWEQPATVDNPDITYLDQILSSVFYPTNFILDPSVWFLGYNAPIDAFILYELYMLKDADRGNTLTRFVLTPMSIGLYVYAIYIHVVIGTYQPNVFNSALVFDPFGIEYYWRFGIWAAVVAANITYPLTYFLQV